MLHSSNINSFNAGNANSRVNSKMRENWIQMQIRFNGVITKMQTAEHEEQN